MEIRPYAAERASALLAGLEAQVRRASKAHGPNTIHDLRVSIRRFSRCLGAFAPLFGSRRVRRIRRRLRRVMSPAGEVRSLDIAVSLWKRARQPADSPCVSRLQRDRRQACKKLQKRLKRLRDRDVARKWEKLWTPPATGGAAVRPNLAALLADYLQAASDLFDGQPSAKALHKFRLATKRVRYTLELFRPCCGPGLEQRIETLRRIQQHLGDLNDYATTRRLVGAKEAAAFTQFLDNRAAARTAELVRYLRRLVLAPERRHWWIGWRGEFRSDCASSQWGRNHDEWSGWTRERRAQRIQPRRGSA